MRLLLLARGGIEHRTLRLEIDIAIFCSACHSARERRRRWPCAGKPAPAGDLLVIFVLESLRALLECARAATIFESVVEHFCIYFSV